MRKLLKQHKFTLQLVASVFFVVAFVLVLKDNNILSQWEHLVTDSLFVKADAPKQVTVIGIDEASLDKYGAWPWDRSVFAQLVTKLDKAGVRVSVFDVILFEPRSGDVELTEALKTASMQVVLAGKIEGNNILTPEAQFLELPNVHTGYANLFADTDGKVRDTQLVRQLSEGAAPSLAYRGLLSYFGIKSDPDYSKVQSKLGFTALPTDADLVVNYVGPRSTVHTISMQQVMADDFDIASLKDQIVFVGSTVQDLKFGLDDNLITPTGIMPGVEIHANVAATVIGNDVIYPINPLLEDVVLIVIAIVAVALLVFLPLGYAAGILVVASGGYVLGMIVLFGTGRLGDFLYTPLALILVAIAGLVWRYLGKYIESLGLRRAFSQYVNEQLLGEILRDPSKLKLGGERRHMTVFFSDIRGFTTISERMDAEQLVEFLNVYLTKATDKILNRRGIVDKYLGDAIMALWGAPLPDEHHALNACLASLDILNVLAEFNAASELDIPKLAIGIGINTGDMVVGNMGSVRRFDYTVMGDNVNLASRLEGLTKKYHCAIILGEGVVAELEAEKDADKLIYRQVDVVTVKGKEKPVKLYQLLDLSSSPDAENLKAMSVDTQVALEEYISGSFISAEEKFLEISKKYNDEVAQGLSERCADLAKSTEPWKGYWTWDSK